MLTVSITVHVRGMSKQTYFYTDKPAFGLDIGHGSLKVMQLDMSQKKPSITGFGDTTFDISALNDGTIADPLPIAKAIHELFQHQLKGVITTRRVAMALPGHRTFSRAIQVPKLSSKELREAVELEIEQYAPMPLTELYLDYTIARETADSYELFAVAVPKKIVDSYLALTDMLNLKPVLIEPTMAASARFFATQDAQSNTTAVIIDFGSLTADICIFDKTITAVSTVPAGGLVFTEAIRTRLQVDQNEAGFIKTKYGLGSSVVQKDVREALEPSLQKTVAEIRRMIRYYDERFGTGSSVGQVVMLGGGANMPGLGDYLTDELRIPVRTHSHPWALFDYDGLKPPAQPDRLMYATVAGLSLLKPNEVFAI
jgi:type IV pilus assembly protein PilM